MGGSPSSPITVFASIIFWKCFVRIEHLPILLTGEVPDQSAHHRAGGLVAVGQFDERAAEDHLAPRVAFSLLLGFACLGGVEPSLGLLVLPFGFFYLSFSHRDPRVSISRLPSPS